MSEAAAIDVHDLRKTYLDGLWRRRKIEALQGVSLRVEPGEIFGLLGPNGAGKTTLIKVVLGIVRKTSGEARMLGKVVGDRRTRLRIGYLPEGHRIPQHLTANSALEFYGSLSGLSVAETKRRRPQLLDTVGLSDWGRTSVRKFSKGMLQRLGLAQAMLHDPDLLILDEPTDGVDPLGRTEIRDVLKQLKDRGKTVFLNSHLLQEVELVCDRVAILHRGQVLRVGSLKELTEQQQMEAVMLLEGDELSIRSALQGLEIVEWSATSTDRVKVGVVISDQSDVDRCVDKLREQGVSIHSMSPRRLTLEQVFLDLVQSNSDKP